MLLDSALRSEKAAYVQVYNCNKVVTSSYCFIALPSLQNFGQKGNVGVLHKDMCAKMILYIIVEKPCNNGYPLGFGDLGLLARRSL